MKVTLTVEADELKVVQLLSKFSEKYRVSYGLHRQVKGYLLAKEYDEGSVVQNGQLLFQIDRSGPGTQLCHQYRDCPDRRYGLHDVAGRADH